MSHLKYQAILRRWRMMGSPQRLADVACSFPYSWDRRLGRTEALWMINDMGWTPESFPNSGHTAMMRCQFRAAIAQFNLYDDVAAAAAQRDQAEAVVDPWAGTAEAPTVPLEVAPDDSKARRRW